MTAQPANFSAFIDAARDSLGREIAAFRREAEREKALREAEHKARLAELDAKLLAAADLQRLVMERLATIKDGEPGKSVTAEDIAPLIRSEVDRAAEDLGKLIPQAVQEAVSTIPVPENGKDADPAVIERMVADAIAALPPAEAGKDADPELTRLMVREETERILAGWEKPKDGHSPSLEELAAPIEEAVQRAVSALPAAERGEQGPMGKLPLVCEWSDRVHYQSEVVTFGGAVYQAQRDTGRQPPHEDWLCIASAGKDARSPRVRSTWSEAETYQELDIVALNGAGFIARRDDPGQCPGEGWQLIASQGKQGKPGDRGQPLKGERGEPGPPVIAMDVDGDGMLTLTNADGSTVSCDLYPILSRL